MPASRSSSVTPQSFAPPQPPQGDLESKQLCTSHDALTSEDKRLFEGDDEILFEPSRRRRADVRHLKNTPSVCQDISCEANEVRGRDDAQVGSENDVVAPPYFPTLQHHSFFMDSDEEASSSCQSVCSACIHRAESCTSKSSLDGEEGDTSTKVVLPGHHHRRLLKSTATLTSTQPPHAEEGPNKILDCSSNTAATRDAADAATGDHALQISSPPVTQTLKATDAPSSGNVVSSSAEVDTIVADANRPCEFNFLLMRHDPALPLYSLSEIAVWQRCNLFIFRGYRAFYSTSMTLKSLFGLHNETINVWSHLLGFLIFLAMTLLLYLTTLRAVIPDEALSSGRAAYAVLCAGCMMCMMNSSLYHLFTGHHHHKVMIAMGRLDFLGITFLIIASFIPPLYTVFHCYRILRRIYIFFILFLGAAGVVGPWTRPFHEYVWLRTTIFVSIAASGVIPALHVLFLFPINAANESWVYGIILMFVLYGIGVFFYVSRFPECRYPGHFDFFLSSHQLWHFFVLSAAIVHYFNCVSMYQLMMISNGAC